MILQPMSSRKFLKPKVAIVLGNPFRRSNRMFVKNQVDENKVYGFLLRASPPTEHIMHRNRHVPQNANHSHEKKNCFLNKLQNHFYFLEKLVSGMQTLFQESISNARHGSEKHILHNSILWNS